MRERLNKAKERAADWLTRQAQSRYALWILGGLSFLDATIPIMPPDVLLIPMIIANRKRWFFLATFVVLCAFLGGLAAYLIGAGLFDVIGAKIIALYGLEEKFAQLGSIYQTNAFFTLFTAGFTPIPDTLFTIGAGLFKLPIPIFLGAYLLGRSLRIYSEALVVYLYGPMVSRLIYRYFNIASLILIALIVVAIILL